MTPMPVASLVLGLLGLLAALRVPFAAGSGVVLGVVLGLTASAVGLVLGLTARSLALRTQAPTGLCTAAVAASVAGLLACSAWVALLFIALPALRGHVGG